MAAKTGVLLINLGTPDGATPGAVRRYLREFLSDPRVIERRGVMWRLALNRVIIPKRVPKSTRAYASIWDRTRDESPLKTITRQQAENLSLAFSSDPHLVVDWAMRYGSPSIESALARLTGAGCGQILIFPLYPQYSGATTASAMDAAFAALARMRAQPAIRTMPPYFAHPAYIGALGQSVTAHLASLPWTPDILVASFHGLPQSFVDRGDPYQRQCEATAGLLRAALEMDKGNLALAYQSRGGRAVWLGPDLETMLADLARRGVVNLCVTTPGFAADCVETLEEIRMRAAAVFLENGGKNFSAVPCLNASDISVRMLRDLAREQLAGWL